MKLRRPRGALAREEERPALRSDRQIGQGWRPSKVFSNETAMASCRAKSTVIFAQATAWSTAACMPIETRKDARTSKRAARRIMNGFYI